MRDTSPTQVYASFLSGGGEMGKRTREKDWSQTPVGTPDTWPQSLRTALSILLNSKFPMFLFWGKELTCFYNDAYRPSLGIDGKHPSILGMPGQEAWPEIWHIIKPLIDQVLAGGESTWSEDQLIPIYRNGKIEDVYWTFSYSPVSDEAGTPAGVFVTCTETTEAVFTRRRLEESERNLRLMVQQAPVAIAIFRGGDYVVELVNARALELWGRTEEEVMQKPILEVMPELLSQGIKDLLDDVYLNGNTFSASELPVQLLRKGILETAYINFVYEPLYAADGTINGLMAVGTEVSEQVLARKKVEASEQRIRTFVENAPFPIGVYIGREMRIELANQAIMDVYGKGNDVMGKLYSELLPELENQAIFSQLDQVFTTGIPFHARNQRVDLLVDGKLQPYYFNYNFTPLYDASGSIYGVMNTAADVTDLIVAKQKIEESEARFRHVADSAPVLIWMSDTHNNAYFFNKAWLHFTGRTMEQESGTGWTTSMYPDDREQCLLTIQNAFDKQEEFYVEYRLRRHDGVYRWMCDNGVPRMTQSGTFEGYIGACMDIHVQKVQSIELENMVKERTKELLHANELLVQKNHSLRVSEHFSRSLTEISPNVVYIYDLEKDENIFINQTGLRIIGYEWDKVLEMKDKVQRLIIHPDDIAAIRDMMSQMRTSEPGVIFEQEYRIRNARGEWIPFLARHTAFMRNTQDEVTQIIGIAVDITDLKKAQASVEQKNTDLEKMNKELQSFTYVSSHDLQEPLRKIQTFATHILEKEFQHLSTNGQDNFRRIQNAAKRMQILINDLLSYSRTSAADPIYEITRLNAIVEEIKEEFTEEIQKKNATIEAHDLGEMPVIPFQFRQLMQNLIGNALKFSRPQVPPHISITRQLIAGRHLHNEQLADNTLYCHIRISDNGIGFEPQYNEKIFELFQRLHGRAEYNGTGIGLAIVKKIVENHNGIIQAQGELNKGATFNIYLPCESNVVSLA